MTNRTRPRSRWNRRRLTIAVPVAGLTVLAAACGSGSSATPSTTAASTVSATTASRSGRSAATVTVESSGYGQILATGAGKTLYDLSADTARKSTCTGKCATIWPPLTVTSVPSLSAGLTRSLLGVVTRPGGEHQLSYAGHPLYTFMFDKAAHQTKGQQIHSFGGIWTVVSAATAKPITAGPSHSASSTASATSGGGY